LEQLAMIFHLPFNQPQCIYCPPLVDSFSQYLSTSCWVFQFTIVDIDSVNLGVVPPFNATNPCPSSSKYTIITSPFGPGPASP